MSSFVHDQDHIDLLVSLAVQVKAYIRVEDPEACWGHRAIGLTTSRSQNLDETLTPTELGKLLLAENVASVRHRYPDVDDTPEVIEYMSLIAEYTYRPVSLTQFGRDWAIAGIKAVNSYQYQSCEHDGWKTSQAKKWAEKIIARLIGEVPGYDQANTWTFSREDALTRAG